MSRLLSIQQLYRYVLILALSVGLVMLSAAIARSQNIKTNPQNYFFNLTAGETGEGFIDVTNQEDTPVTLAIQLQAANQDSRGNLEFREDKDLLGAIVVEPEELTLSPHEVKRVRFEVESDQLRDGPIHAAITWRKVEVTSQDELESEFGASGEVRVGPAAGSALLIIANNQEVTRRSDIADLKTTFWHLGDSIDSQLTLKNSSPEADGIAFMPTVKIEYSPWAEAEAVEGPLLFPRREQVIDVFKKGSYIGPVKVVASDPVSGTQLTRWVFAVTGWYHRLVVLVGIGVVCIGLIWLISRRAKKRNAPKRLL
jgi:hypothetical protein